MRLRNWLLALLLCLVLQAPAVHAAEDTWSGVERIVAVGDVHGDFAQFTSILRAAGVIDRDNHWSGGKTHLVQTGDMVDRGPDTRKCLDLLMALEKEAPAAGGEVHALIGNHETMNLYGDLRYVSAGDYASFRTDKSEGVRDMYYQQHLKDLRNNPPAEGMPQIDDNYRKKWEATHPPGYFERASMFAADGVYGKWIRSHNAIIKVNDLIFVHGGIGPKYAKANLKKINDEVAKELKDFSRLKGGMVVDPEGPLWYRGLADGDEGKLASHVSSVLERLGAEHIVIGHTVTKGMVTPRFDGKVLMIDVGLSAAYGGRLACFIDEGGKLFAMHRGTRVPLPANMGADLTRYLSQVNALDLTPRP